MKEYILLHISKNNRVAIRHAWIKKMGEVVVKNRDEIDYNATIITFWEDYKEDPLVVLESMDRILELIGN